MAPDYMFVLGWNQLLKEPLLQVPSGFVVGSHPTPLPQRRGRAPVPWTILEGHRNSAVTLFRMLPGVDSGPILIQRWFGLSERPYAFDVYDRVAEELALGFKELYEQLENNCYSETEQSVDQVCYRAKRIPADGHLEFGQTADGIDRLIRAVSEPFPGAYTYFNGNLVHVWRVRPYCGPDRRGNPGQILAKDGEWLIVQPGDRPIEITELTIAGEPAPIGMFPIGGVFGYRVEDTLAYLCRRVTELEQSMREKGH